MNSSEYNPADIKAIVTDIDGVLTDGAIGYGCGSEDEIKFFNVKDGSGLQLARHAGLKIAALSGRVSKANRKRLAELHFDIIKEKILNKTQGILDICEELGIAADNVMYIGDDLIDIPAARLVGLPVAVADSSAEYIQCCKWLTERPGGHGAVREAIERLLREQGRLQAAIDSYLGIQPMKDRAQ